MPDEPNDPKPPDSGKPDAILLPPTYNPKGDPRSFLLRINAEFGPVLGCKRVTTGQVGSNRLLFPFSKVPVHTMYHSKDSEFEGEDRYEWTDRGDGVQYGRLTEDARKLLEPVKANPVKTSLIPNLDKPTGVDVNPDMVAEEPPRAG